ncbi:uncharacterized protein LOC123542463 [Mercenaria mercenaria]|uniref:uncharacterized protein LOC123542463 n=1 Tax=Mercenaria mercenaria TaxID=6596 RepID=UPI001E1DA27B|nr:uncharacterized protein LOC123542463 [Mercenaria mercenaria]
MAATLVKAAGKIGVAVGAVVVTASQGVWSTNNEMGVKALNKVRSKVLPAANEIVEKIPTRETVKNKSCNTWNSGVKTVFSSLSTAPEKSANYIRKSIQDLRK